MRYYLGIFINQQGSVFYILLRYQKQHYTFIQQGSGLDLAAAFEASVSIQKKQMALYRARIYLCICLDHQYIESALMKFDLAGFERMSDWWQHEAVAIEFAEYVKTDINQLYWDWCMDKQAGGIQVYYTDKQQLEGLAERPRNMRLQSLSFSQAAHEAYQNRKPEQHCLQLAALKTIEQCTAYGAIILGIARYGK